MSTREQIKEVAVELLIRHGYRGLRFGDIAERLGVVRPNIHYHFNTKKQLVEEVVTDHIAQTEADFRLIWLAQDSTLNQKINQTMEYTRRRYSRFNTDSDTGSPWSLIARMRGDQELLTDKGRTALEQFGPTIEANVQEAIIRAKDRGELKPETPVDDLALQIVSIANSAGSISQDARSFQRLEQLYLGFARIIAHAYGTTAARHVGKETIPAPNEKS